MIELFNMVFIICTFVVSVITLTLVAADKVTADKISYAKMHNNEFIDELSDIEQDESIDKDI